MPSLFISFRGKDGAWTPARDLKGVLGASSAGSSPWVTLDGKYMFFRDVSGPNWVDAGFIEVLRKAELLRPAGDVDAQAQPAAAERPSATVP